MTILTGVFVRGLALGHQGFPLIGSIAVDIVSVGIIAAICTLKDELFLPNHEGETR